MSEEIKTLEGLEAVAETVTETTETPAVEAVIHREPIRDDLGRSYATGKRKDAVARVWIKPGSGKVMVRDAKGNYIDYTKYFARPVLQMILRQPFDSGRCERPV